jgi:hypothetical protein
MPGSDSDTDRCVAPSCESKRVFDVAASPDSMLAADWALLATLPIPSADAMLDCPVSTCWFALR